MATAAPGRSALGDIGDDRGLGPAELVPVCFALVDHYQERWGRLAWVRVEGEAVVVPSGAAWPEALAALRGRYAQYRPMALERLPVIRIRPKRVVGWRWQGDGSELA